MANTNPCHIVTGKVRLSYTNLFNPRANNPGDDPKYSTTILVPKSDLETKRRIDGAIAAATDAGVSKKWNGIRPPMISVCVHDGDGSRPSDGMPFGDECKGHWVFTASSKQAPQVVDGGINPILDAAEVYSGVYARVGVTFFPYNSNGKKGIGCGLETVQKLEDGEPLGSRASAASDFADSAGYAAPVQGYAVPGYPAYPPVQPQMPPMVDPITGLPVAR